MKNQSCILIVREILQMFVYEHISLKLFLSRIPQTLKNPMTTYITELNFLGRFSLLSEW